MTSVVVDGVNIRFGNWKITHRFRARSRAIVNTVKSEKDTYNFAAGDSLVIFDNAGNTLFEGYLESRGKVLENGEVTLRADGVLKKYMSSKFELDFSETSTTDNIIMSETFNSLPITLLTPSNGVTVGNYTIKDKRQVVWSEMQNFYNKVLKYKHNGDDEAIYENVGFTNSGLTLDDSNEAVRITEFDDDTEIDVVTFVEVFGQDINGNTIVGSAGSNASDAVYERVRVDYVLTQSEADEIAQSVLNTSPVKRVKLDAFFVSANLVNQVVNVNSATYGLNNEDLVVKQQELFSSRRMTLQLGLIEGEIGVREASKTQRELIAERSQLLSGDEADVGNQTAEGDVDQGFANVDADENDESPAVDGFTGLTNTEQAVSEYTKESFVFGSGTRFRDVRLDIPAPAGGLDYAVITFSVVMARNSSELNQSFNVAESLFGDNVTTGQQYFSFSGSQPSGSDFEDPLQQVSAWTATVVDADAESGDEIRFNLWEDDNTNVDWFFELRIFIYAVGKHDHNVNLNTALHKHGVTVDDNGHIHVVNVSTGEKLLNLSKLDKVNR